MIKTLRITTFIAAILAVGVLAFPVVYGYRGDEEIEKFLKSPGAIERFKKAKGAKVKTGNQISPLVKQAVLYGMIINPEPSPPIIPRTRPPQVAREVVSVVPKNPVSVKFDLVGTSYYASRPELSLAYINEPGKGLYWVRQGASVGHLLIEEVKDGSIIVKDRERTVTLAPKRTPKKSLIKGETTSATTLPGISTSITSTSSVPVAAGAGQSAVSVVEKTTAVPALDRRTLLQTRNVEQDADAVLADFIKDLKAQQSGAGADEGYSEAEKAELKEAIAAFEAMRVSAEEAQRLDRLGKELKQRIPARTGGSKVGKSVSPPPPPRPTRTPTRRPPTRRPPTRPPSQPTK